MNAKQKEITRISQEFASGFADTIGGINNSAWLIADPLSGYLNSIGYANTPGQMPETDKHPQVLVLTFEDGSTFIPAGGDLKPLNEAFENWMWL